uniref:Leucine-rich repeat-containing N-terminal plant-type domain-containing protein n=1 Tax=Oryza meridionalis TaxID=40149 RepID=A0A0E0DKT8_9ORYZ
MAMEMEMLMLLLILVAAASKQCHPSDRAALGNKFPSWTTSTPCCDWSGIQCDATTGRVVDLAVDQDDNLTARRRRPDKLASGRGAGGGEPGAGGPVAEPSSPATRRRCSIGRGKAAQAIDVSRNVTGVELPEQVVTVDVSHNMHDLRRRS